MKAVRYELTCGGERQGCGVFAGMSELNLDDDALGLLEKPFSSLEIPFSKIAGGPRCSFWFTEKGEEAYSSAVRKLIEAYEERTCFSAERIERDVRPDEIVWMDGNQMALRAD